MAVADLLSLISTAHKKGCGVESAVPDGLASVKGAGGDLLRQRIDSNAEIAVMIPELEQMADEWGAPALRTLAGQLDLGLGLDVEHLRAMARSTADFGMGLLLAGQTD